jgi:hypothetical protein
MTEQKTLREQLKTGLIKDFNHLYVKKYSTGWKIQRFVRRTEINLMSFDNTIKAILKEVEGAGLTDYEIENIENEYPRKFGIALTAANAQLGAVKKILGKV